MQTLKNNKLAVVFSVFMAVGVSIIVMGLFDGAWAKIYNPSSTSTLAPYDATYITQTANGTLTAEQALSSLSRGIGIIEEAGDITSSAALAMIYGGTASTTPLTGILKGGSSYVQSAIAGTDYIALISQDTTPKLGAALDTNYFSITFRPTASDDSYSGETVTSIAFVTLTIGDFVFCNTYQTDDAGNCKADKADADTASTMPAFARATAACTAGNTCTLLVRGYWKDTNDTWTTVTSNRFVHPSATAGGETQVAPSTSGQQVQRACRIVSATLEWCDFDDTVVQL